MEGWSECEEIQVPVTLAMQVTTVLTVCLFLQNPNDWLKKHLDIEDITVNVSARHTLSGSDSPLVRTRALRLAALAPVFAVLADRAVAGQTTAVIDIVLEPVIATVSSQQVTWLKTFAQMMPTVVAARGMHQETLIQANHFSCFPCWLRNWNSTSQAPSACAE